MPVFQLILTSDTINAGREKINIAFSATTGLWSGSTGFQSLIHNNGTGNIAIGDYSIASGSGNIAQGDYSFAQGIGNLASGVGSHAEGGALSSTVYSGTSATTFSSHAEGIGTLSSGVGSHAEGRGTIASGNTSHAEGFQTIAGGESSHAEGSITTASGDFSHTEGGGTIASGDYSHAEGRETVASGDYSHAEGRDTIASGNTSHAEGSQTTAGGGVSHAEGFQTIAIGSYSHAEGLQTLASGQASHAAGTGTIARSDSQYVIGRYNDSGNTTNGAFIIGNGNSNLLRRNILEAPVDSSNAVLVRGFNALATSNAFDVRNFFDNSIFKVTGLNVGVNLSTNPLSTLHVNGDIRHRDSRIDYSNSVSTFNNSITNLATAVQSTNADRLWVVKVSVLARKTPITGSADYFSQVFYITVQDSATGASQLGAIDIIHEPNTGVVGLAVTTATISNNLVIRVQGNSGENWTWYCDLERRAIDA
jgi:hypothetical protein